MLNENIPRIFEQEEIYTPSLIIKYTYNLIKNQQVLKNIWVEGEVLNLRKISNGHIYFYLKDEESSIQCTVFNYELRQNFVLSEIVDGKKIKIFGNVTLYKKNGTLQINVLKIESIGKGNIYEILRKLYDKLNREGLFDSSRKKKIPLLPINLGIITSEMGAVLRDIVKIARKRFPQINIIFVPTIIQGKEAKNQILKSLEFLNGWQHPEYKIDVIIVARGGGSFDELLVFNDEEIVRAFANSKIPVISAIGHQIDHPLCEYAADYAAATPSEAAERSVPEISEIYKILNSCAERMKKALIFKIQIYKEKLSSISRKNIYEQPVDILNEYYQILDNLNTRLIEKIKLKLNKKKTELLLLREKIIQLDPDLPLKKGFFYLKKDNQTVKEISKLKPDDQIEIFSHKGKLRAIITEVHMD